jgi:hypothetical protein
LAAKDDVEHALERFSEAVELFVEDKRWRDASRVCRAWANVLRSRARNDEAFDVLDRAAELAARSGTVTAR